MKALLLDNLDSFTHNLRHGLVEAGAEVVVRRRDACTVEDLAREAADLLVLGPGPGRPEEAHLCLDAIARFLGRVPLLGVCLGHQCLALALGGDVGRAPAPVHGKTSEVRHNGEGLFQGLPQPLTVGRYHSLTVTRCPEVLEPTAWAEDGALMAFRHCHLPVAGVQFHPDSFLTPQGIDLFRHALAGRF